MNDKFSLRDYPLKAASLYVSALSFILENTIVARTNPNLSCTVILTDDEWKVLYTKMLKTKNYPETPPPIREIVRWLAKLGGFLARKNDLEPGPTTLWKGWKRLFDLAEGWRLAHEFYTYG